MDYAASGQIYTVCGGDFRAYVHLVVASFSSAICCSIAYAGVWHVCHLRVERSRFFSNYFIVKLFEIL